MTAFDGELRDIMQAMPGAYGVSIMGYDGIAVASSEQEQSPIPLSELLVEFGGAFVTVMNAAKEKQFGQVDDFSLSSGKYRLLTKSVNQEYFLAIFLNKSAIYGKASFLLRRAASRLRPSL